MPYYLTSFIGSGTVPNPCRAIGTDDPGSRIIDLRKDGGATFDGAGFNQVLLYSPSAVVDAGVTQFADAPGENLSVGIRAIIAARLGITISFSRLDDIIAEMLLRPPLNGWKKLRPPYQLHLGDLAPVYADIPQAASYTETWSTGDNASLTSSLAWTEFTGTEWAIASNMARCTGPAAGLAEARADADVSTVDHKVQATLVSRTYVGGEHDAWVFCRKANDAVRNYYYFAAIHTAAGSLKWQLGKAVAGTNTMLAENATDPVDGDVMLVKAAGSSISGIFNATVVGPVTDTAITGNTRGGITQYSENIGNIADFDAWSIADLGADATRTLMTVSSPLRW